MAREEKSAQEELDTQAPQEAAAEKADQAAPAVVTPAAGTQPEPSDAPEPSFTVALVPDSGLEAPVFVDVAGLADSGVKLDKHDRLALSESKVTVPPALAANLEGIPYVEVRQVR